MAPAGVRGAVAVLGAGSWGTALAILLARNQHRTLLWGNDAAHIEQLSHERCNTRYLPAQVFPELLSVTPHLEQALSGAPLILLAIPSHALRVVVESLQPLLKSDHQLAWATKGLESNSAKLPHQVVAEVLGERSATAVISGPTFAREVAGGLPTAVTVASGAPQFAAQLAALLHGANFRAYTSSDICGVELGGAVKNVLAIAAGIADGLGFGANARAALITRGLAEMMRLGTTLGGQRDTFMGLAGLGDLLLTCTDDQSRNRRLGLALAHGNSVPQATTAIGQVVEGIQTAREVVTLAQRHTVEMPICHAVYRVLYEALSPTAAVQALLAREPKSEIC
ncbi:MAG: NAD(P)H-dependent glycerol-3-phosphate dehydrogenase [Gammaproteobacteria bacterium]